MPGNRKSLLRRGVTPLDNHARINDIHDVSPASSFGGSSSLAPNLPRPVHDIEFQPSEICPQNYVIFDESDNQSRIMFHPAIAQNFSYPQLNFHETPNRDVTEEKCGNIFEGANNAPPVIEDSEYIDLLLSLDEEGGSEEEEVSTARTENYDGCSSPESCCNYASKSQKLTYPSSVKRSSIGGSSHNENKKKEARKMMKSLRGMVPGGDQMNTAGVFDAAVRYLNGLEDKVQKLGLSNLKHKP